MKPIRFLPLVALAAFSLLVLKMAGLMMGERYMLTGPRQTLAKAAPDAKPDTNSSSPEDQKKSDKPEKDKAKKTAKKKSEPPKDITHLVDKNYRSNAEVLLLTSLAKRREQLDRRESKLELHLKLISAAEKRIAERIVILKKLESKIQHFAKLQKEEKKTQFNRLVKMYSAMKPKDAARIFNELDNKVLLGIIKNMKPQAMSAILAAMAPVKAREMTISLAGNTQKKFTKENLDELPKINGN
jgi:flagellar motility protein MotE (MotC chaperone)